MTEDRGIRIPKGPTQCAWNFNGYQEALLDIQEALLRGGEEAVQEWLANNLSLNRVK
jgi:hypothetical protein